jgi:hypothetical protein
VAGLQAPLTTDERDEIVLAAKSVFKKLKNLYEKVAPIFQDYGFTPPSAGVIARDLSEKIEKAIIQHSHSFTKERGTATSVEWVLTGRLRSARTRA